MSGQGADDKKLSGIKNDSNTQSLPKTHKSSKSMPRTYYSEQTSTPAAPAPDLQPLESEEIPAPLNLETQTKILNPQSSPIEMTKQQETPATNKQSNVASAPRSNSANNIIGTATNNKSLTLNKDQKIPCYRRQKFPETSNCRPWTPCEEACTSVYVPLTRCKIIEPSTIIRKTPLPPIRECNEWFSQSENQTPNGRMKLRELHANNLWNQESQGWINDEEGGEYDHGGVGRGRAGYGNSDYGGTDRGGRDQGGNGGGGGKQNKAGRGGGVDQSRAGLSSGGRGGANRSASGQGGPGVTSSEQGSATEAPAPPLFEERGRTPPKKKSNEAVFSLDELPPIIRKVFPYYPRGLIIPKCMDIIKGQEKAKRKKSSKPNKGESGPWDDALRNFYNAIRDADEFQEEYEEALDEDDDADVTLTPELLERRELAKESGTLSAQSRKQTAAEEVESIVQGKMAQIKDLFDAELKGLTETYEQLKEERDPLVEESLQTAWTAKKRDLQQQIEEFLNNVLDNIIAAHEQGR